MSGKQWSTKLKVPPVEHGILIQENTVLELQVCIHPTIRMHKYDKSMWKITILNYFKMFKLFKNLLFTGCFIIWHWCGCFEP